MKRTRMSYAQNSGIVNFLAKMVVNTFDADLRKYRSV